MVEPLTSHHGISSHFTSFTLYFQAQRLKEERLKLLAAMTDELGVSIDPETGTSVSRGRSTRLQTRIGGQRVNYNEDAYFRARMLEARNLAKANEANSKKNNLNKLKVPESLPDLRYWQLFDGPKLVELNALEWQWFMKWKNDSRFDAEKHGECGLNEEQQMEKARVLREGFPSITYRIYGLFVRCCIKFGRDSVEEIVEEMIDNMMDEADSEQKDDDEKVDENEDGDVEDEDEDGDAQVVDEDEDGDEDVAEKGMVVKS